jgi:hypothetical protein
MHPYLILLLLIVGSSIFVLLVFWVLNRFGLLEFASEKESNSETHASSAGDSACLGDGGGCSF